MKSGFFANHPLGYDWKLKKMAKFWWSGEVQADVGNSYRETMKAIDLELNRRIEGVSLGAKTNEWAFIAIIREEDSPDYAELVRKSSKGQVLEFRLKIVYESFLASTPDQQVGLIFNTLHRSVALMEQLGVPATTRNELAGLLFQAEEALRQSAQ